MSAVRTCLILLAAAGTGGAVTWLLTRGSTAHEPVQRPGATAAREEPSPEPPRSEPSSADPPTPEVDPPATADDRPVGEGMLLLPDGGYVAPLNGVTNPPKLIWDNPEWSPIVRIEHNGELDWYVHADGSYSTTLWMWRKDLGRMDAVSYSLHPRDPVPTAPLPPEGEPAETAAEGPPKK
ncbi:MAG: hypothetical protein KDE27_08325 [Planctomycetes bacterium]|nr:hypothetical protein [Planctomycetota bacterium]